ncbi:hypothetical protein RCL1_003361 [Eukaryota sp. TZLM3-RCL]
MHITEELLRKRAEHNDGCLNTLREISLHQQNLTKIDTIHLFCRQLEILFLQCNAIRTIENLHHLKKLRYLNLAVNGLTSISNLDRCESLNKLDFTANFIDNVNSLLSLKSLYNLHNLYLTGNPICDAPNYRLFVISVLPQLKSLDGVQISNSERILAEKGAEGFLNAAEQWYSERVENGTAGKVPENWFESQEVVAKSREYEKQRAESSTNAASCSSYEEARLAEVPLERNGKIVQVNQPRVDFRMYEEHDGKECLCGTFIVANISISKFIATSLLSVDVQPLYFEVTIKGHLLRVVYSEEVVPSKAKVQRVTTTGALIIKVPKLCPGAVIHEQKKTNTVHTKITKIREEEEFLTEIFTTHPRVESTVESLDSEDELPPLE